MIHSLPSVPSSKSAVKPPAWHAEAATLIRNNHAEITHALQDATRRAVWFGLLFQHVKARGKADHTIPHGQFRKWIKQNVPDVPDSTVTFYMTIGRGVMESARLEIPKMLKLAFSQDGELPKEVLPVIEGKTQQQLFLEYRQAKVKDDCYIPARGNLSGKGNPKSQRENAALRSEAEQREADELMADQVADWIKQSFDDSRVGHPLFSKDALGRLRDAITYAHGYLRTHRVNS